MERASQQKAKSKPNPDPLQGGSFGQVDANELHNKLGGQLTEWLKLKTDQLEQRVDLKMSGLERELLAKLNSKPGIGALALNSVLIVLAILGVMLAVLAFGGQAFNGGMSATGALAQVTAAQDVQQSKLNAKIDDLSNQITAMRKGQAKCQPKNGSTNC